MLQQNWKTQQLATGLVKVSFHSNQKKGKAKEYSNYHTIALISHAIEAWLGELIITLLACEMSVIV